MKSETCWTAIVVYWVMAVLFIAFGLHCFFFVPDRLASSSVRTLNLIMCLIGGGASSVVGVRAVLSRKHPPVNGNHCCHG